MRFRYFISSLLITLILFIPIVLSDTLGITAEYENVTTTIIVPETTTTPEEGGPGKGVWIWCKKCLLIS